MKSRKMYLLQIVILALFQSCYFGAGLVEQQLTDDYYLFANSSYQEMAIWNDGQMIVQESVYAFGYDNDFIIALSHPRTNDTINKDITLYHIIDLNENPEFNSENNTNLSFQEFQVKFDELEIDKGIDYTLVFENIE